MNHRMKVKPDSPKGLSWKQDNAKGRCYGRIGKARAAFEKLREAQNIV